MTKTERRLVSETEREALVELDEDALLELHSRVRRARTKYVKNYRRAASSRVVESGSRGIAYPKNQRDRDKAEVFELPVGEMLDRARWSLRETSHPQARFARVPQLSLEGRVVWGLTGIILRDFVRRAAAFDPGE